MTEAEVLEKLSDPKIPILEKKKIQEQYNHDNASKNYNNSTPQSSKD
jgi:hypothetical protein